MSMSRFFMILMLYFTHKAISHPRSVLQLLSSHHTEVLILPTTARPSSPTPFYEYRFVNMWQLFSVKLILLGRRIGLCGDATRAPIQGLRAMGEVS